jgi:hypothetical protein
VQNEWHSRVQGFTTALDLAWQPHAIIYARVCLSTIVMGSKDTKAEFVITRLLVE